MGVSTFSHRGDGSATYPIEEMGQQHKLLQPWHGPYLVIRKDDLDVTVTKVGILPSAS